MIINLSKLKPYLVVLLCACMIIVVLTVTTTRTTTAENKIMLPILMYHHMTVNGEFLGPYCIDVTEFEHDLKYMKEEGYTSILTADLIDYVYKGKELPAKPIMITFDDGCESTYAWAYPLLKKYNMKAIISVIGKFTDKASQGTDHNPVYAYISWEHIKELSESGVFEIQNHSYDMHETGLRYGSGKKWNESEAVYAETLTNDIMKLQNEIFQNTGVKPTSYTYPYGKISPEALPIIKSLGFKIAFTCREKVNYITRNKEQLYSLCRYNRPHGISTWGVFRHFEK